MLENTHILINYLQMNDETAFYNNAYKNMQVTNISGHLSRNNFTTFTILHNIYINFNSKVSTLQKHEFMWLPVLNIILTNVYIHIHSK